MVRLNLFMVIFIFALASIFTQCSEEKKQLHHYQLSLASYNIRNAKGLDEKVSYERIAEVIKKLDTDAIAIQEIDSCTNRSEGLFVLEELAKRTGMYPIYAPAIEFDGGKYGIGILCKQKPLSIKHYPLPGEEEKRTLMVAEFDHYIFSCTHLSLTEKDRLSSAKIIYDTLKSYKKPVFIGGDWNDTPDSKFITEMNQNFYLLTDTASHTFPASLPETTIDYIAALKQDKTKINVSKAEVYDAEIESDHRPVKVIIDYDY